MIKAALIGAGNRGKDVYGKYAIEHADEIEFIAVAEPDNCKRQIFSKQHNIPENMQFTSWMELLDRPKLCDVIFICSQDRMHYEPAMSALDTGYDILLEKPMAVNLKECVDLAAKARQVGRSVTVAHVLRYTPFFKKVKDVISSGKLGDIVTINLNENVGYWHYAHSYVRGNWANSDTSSPMILAKSCHDMDILVYLVNRKPRKIASFGSLMHFKADNAPEDSAERCLDCKIRDECPYSAAKLYQGTHTGWPVSVISSDLSPEGRIKALKEGPYGRCVYRCDNNVVDHQVVNIEFEGGINAAFTMCGFTSSMTRDIRVMGTRGVLEGSLEEDSIEVNIFGSDEKEIIDTEKFPGAHSGGDTGLMKYFTGRMDDNVIEGLTSAEVSIISHVMAFAAEESRLSEKVIDIAEYMRYKEALI